MRSSYIVHLDPETHSPVSIGKGTIEFSRPVLGLIYAPPSKRLIDSDDMVGIGKEFYAGLRNLDPWWPYQDTVDYVGNTVTLELWVSGGADAIRIIVETPLDVDIDVKPGNDLNPINIGSNGVIPVAILSSDSFNALTVKVHSIRLGGNGVAIRGKSGNLLAREKDVNRDGLDDLLVHIETEGFEDPGESGIVILTGETFDGIPIEGTDSVKILPPDPE